MTDSVDHPSHYTAYRGIEVIELTEQLNFCRGSAVKYIARAGLKDPEKEIEDLQKAKWYIDREINRISTLRDEEAESRVTREQLYQLGYPVRSMKVDDDDDDEPVLYFDPSTLPLSGDPVV